MTFYVKCGIIIVEILKKGVVEVSSKTNNFVSAKGGKDMVEKLKFERKEKRNCRIKQIIIGIVGILLAVGECWFLTANDETKESFVYFLVSWINVLLIIAIIYIICFCLNDFAKEKVAKNIKEFDFCSQVDDLLAYLEQSEDLNVKLKLKSDFLGGLEEARDVILNPNNDYYVKKVGKGTLYILAHNKETNKMKIIFVTEDYEFFFSYFELEKEDDITWYYQQRLAYGLVFVFAWIDNEIIGKNRNREWLLADRGCLKIKIMDKKWKIYWQIGMKCANI